MEVTVRFTGMTKMAIGNWEETFTLGGASHTLEDLLEAVLERHGPKLGEHLDRQVCVVHSGDTSLTVYPRNRSVQLKPGDVVTLLSQFAGG